MQRLSDRLSWDAIPASFRNAAVESFRATVVDEQRHTGGFSPGLASTLRLADGRQVFMKAIHPDRDPDAPLLYRREIAVAASLPPTVPAPGLLWWYDHDDWVALAFEHVEGRHPAEPWNGSEFGQVVATIDALAAELTPSPLTTVPSAVDDLADSFGSWARLAQDPVLVDRLDDWPRTNLDRLVQLESGWKAAIDGNSLCHTDLRADNLLITDHGVVIIDWPYAVTGAAWLDLLFLLPSVAVGEINPQQAWDSSAVGRATEPDAVTTAITALAGYYVASSLKPVPPNIPGLRPVQAAKGRATLGWLQDRIR